MKKALFNFITDDVTYVAGQLYPVSEITHLDQTNFSEVIGEEIKTKEIKTKEVKGKKEEVEVLE